MMKKSVFCFLLAVILLLTASCTKSSDSNKNFYDEFPTGTEIETIEIEENPTATITLADGSKIEIELYYYSAPNAVSDFIAMAKAGVYDGMAFNEVRNKCIVMMGATEGDFVPPYYLIDEIPEDGSAQKLSHEAGVVSMIRTSNADTLTGQFFILTKDQKHFDNRFTSFGKVTEGMEIVEKIAASTLNEDGRIAEPYVIKSIKVDTNGNTFPDPHIIPKG